MPWSITVEETPAKKAAAALDAELARAFPKASAKTKAQAGAAKEAAAKLIAAIEKANPAKGGYTVAAHGHAQAGDDDPAGDYIVVQVGGHYPAEEE